MRNRRLIVAAVLLCAFGVVLLAVATHWRPLHTLDTDVRDHLDSFGMNHPGWVHAWRVVTNALQPLVWRVVALLAAVALVLRRQWAAAVGLAIVVAGAAVLSTVVKAAVDRPRPAPFPGGLHAVSASFPSGHALTAAAALIGLLVAVPVAVRIPNWLGAALVGVGTVLVIAVSFSRLAVGVHYLSDVIGGLLLGAGWALGALVLLETILSSGSRDRV
jgi:undecaprenyl-diphosphatase